MQGLAAKAKGGGTRGDLMGKDGARNKKSSFVSTRRQKREHHLASRRGLKPRPHTPPHLEQADAIVDLRLAQAELPEDGSENHGGAEVSDHLVVVFDDMVVVPCVDRGTEEKQATKRRVRLSMDGMVVSHFGDGVILYVS